MYIQPKFKYFSVFLFFIYLFGRISRLRNTKIPQADYFSTNYDLFEVMRKKFVEKILASCCQHVNGIRFEESTMTKYRTVRTGRGGPWDKGQGQGVLPYFGPRYSTTDHWIQESIKRILNSGLFWAVGAAEKKNPNFHESTTVGFLESVHFFLGY